MVRRSVLMLSILAVTLAPVGAVAAAASNTAPKINIRLAPRRVHHQVVVSRYVVSSSGAAMTVTVRLHAQPACRWVRVTGRSAVSSSFDTGFLGCGATMRRAATVLANTSPVTTSAEIGLQVWNARHTKMLQVAYVQLLIQPPGSPAGTTGPAGTTTTQVGTTTTPRGSTTTSIPRPATTTTGAPPTTATQPSSSGAFSPVHTTRWAGYFENVGAVTSAAGTWTVPHLTCPAGATTASSTWIGVGGLNGGVLFQAGMFDNCVGGVEEHGAFVETYPGGIGNFSLAIRPGDVVSVALNPSTGGNWTARVTDRTTGQSEVGTGAYAGGADVEWFTEAYATPTYPLSHFGSEQLSSFTVNGASAHVGESDVWEIPGVAVPTDPATGVYRLTTP